MASTATPNDDAPQPHSDNVDSPAKEPNASLSSKVPETTEDPSVPLSSKVPEKTEDPSDPLNSKVPGKTEGSSGTLSSKLPEKTEAALAKNVTMTTNNLVMTRINDMWADLMIKEFIPVKVLNFLLYGGMMALFPFLTLQARSLGINESELGIMYGFIPIIALFGPPVAGIVADKIGNFKYFLATTMLLSGFTALLYMPIPAGRIKVPLGEVMSMDLVCAGGGAPNTTLLPLTNITCNYNNATRMHWVFISSCRQACISDGETGLAFVEEEDIKVLYLTSQANEPNTTELLQVAINSSTDGESNTNQFTPTEVNLAMLVQPTAQDKGLTVNETLCFELTENLADWLVDRTGREFDRAQCHAECRVLAQAKQLCTNRVTVVDVNPTLTFWAYLCVRLLNSLALATTVPLYEGAVVTILKQYNGDFGFQRMYGSLGPLVLTPFSGWLIDKYSKGSHQNYSPAFYLYFVIKILCVLVILTMNLEFKKPSKRVIEDLKAMLSSAEICCFLFMIFVAGVCFGAMDTFLFWLLQDMGASKILMGLTITVGNVCSLPILFLATPIIQRFGSVNTIILGFSFYVVRFIGYSFIYNPWLCMPFEALECFTVALLITSAISYSAELSNPTNTAMVQGLMGGLHYGIGRGVGSLIGGFVMAAIGLRWTFRVMAAIAFVAAIIYFIINGIFFREAAKARKLKKELEKQNSLQMANIVSAKEVEGLTKRKTGNTDEENPSLENDRQM